MEEKLFEVIAQFKKNKVGGKDNIVNELLKLWGYILIQRIFKIWKEEKMPSKWKKG